MLAGLSACTGLETNLQDTEVSYESTARRNFESGEKAFTDERYNEAIKFTAPVSGTIQEVVRGEKRRILEVRIKTDSSTEYRDFGTMEPSSAGAEAVKERLLEGGYWPAFMQRPYAIIARPEQQPKAIFVSGFDSAPLAPDSDFVMASQMGDFQKGIDALVAIANGKPVHLSFQKGSKVYTQVQGAHLHEVSGPHPAGNVGVQIHHIDPVNKGEVVWTVDYQNVANIGRFLSTGKVDPMRTVALVGSEVNQPKYYRVHVGTCMNAMVKNQMKGDNVRLISGNVLTGDHVAQDGFLGWYANQVTAIPEGHDAKFLLTDGWLSPGLKKFSLSHAYPTWLMPKSKRFNLDTNKNGEERAFVVTGQYEKVFPFDIYPVQLVKSIIVNDVDQMEKLGIYEVAPEDFALCEFSCTSKIDVQSIVREGLDTIRAEFS